MSTAAVPPPLFSSAFFRDPYPTYHSLRSTAPVQWDESVHAWVLTTYAAVAAALTDPHLARGRTPAQEADFLQRLTARGQADLLPLHRLLADMMLFSDPPKHTRLRALANTAFTPRIAEGMRPHVQAIVDDLLDRVQAAGAMDVIQDLAYPLPIRIIAELLSLPAEDRPRFKRWSDAIIAFSASLGGSPEQALRAQPALASLRELRAYFPALVRQLRQEPSDTLLSALVVVTEQEERLSEDELLATAVLLLMNGHETITYMIGNGLLALLRHPEQWARLRADPVLITTGVEELLRYDGSVQLRGLGIAEDWEVDGTVLRKGQSVMALIGAANRDPAQFPDPDQLDVARQVNRHLDFGRGIHFCLGAALARVELQVALTTVLQRLPQMRLAVPLAALEWQTVPVFRGLRALPVAF
jgi:pimeloyl-[acyl-carrier protein] synthase